MLEDIYFLKMIVEMKVLTVFFTRERCSTEISFGWNKVSGCHTKATWATFVYVIMLLLSIPRHLLGNCRVSTWVRKAVYLFNIYSNISENIRNIQILILSRKMHSLEISFASWPATLLKLRLWHRRFSVTFARFLRTSFFKEHLWWLLLYLKQICTLNESVWFKC